MRGQKWKMSFKTISSWINKICATSERVDFLSRSTFNQTVVPVLVLLFVALWFILRGDFFHVLPYVILFLCFSVLLVLRLPRLGKRELILVLFVRLFNLRLFGFVCFLFLLVSGKGCGLWLWHSLDFSLTFFLAVFVMEILQKIAIHLSSDMKRTFASFSGHTLSVEVQTNRRLKLPKKKTISEIWLLGTTKCYYSVYWKGDDFNLKNCFAVNFIDKLWSLRFYVKMMFCFWTNILQPNRGRNKITH